MTQLTRDDLKQVLKEVGAVTKNDLKEMGVVTEKVLKRELTGVVTEKVLKRELNKVTRKLQESIANVALSSPTIKQFSELEKRVSNPEVFAN